MALAQQGKTIDEKLLDNYVNRGTRHDIYDCHFLLLLELPIPSIDPINDLEDRLIRTLRNDQSKNSLCFRYGDLCSLDTIQVEVAAEKKGNNTSLKTICICVFVGVIIRHFEYEITSLVNILLLLYMSSFFSFPISVTRIKSHVDIMTLLLYMNY